MPGVQLHAATVDDVLSQRFMRKASPAVDVFTTGCLLYTSDAADERSSVDLGGRRIIKKKKKREQQGGRSNVYNEIKIR